MRLAVDITTCTPHRSGIGYYAEHLVDALLETRRADDDVVLLTNQAPAPELAARWASHIEACGPDARAAWMQFAAPGLLARTHADVALFPNFAVPLASPCPTIAVVHDLSALHMPESATLQKRLLMKPLLQQVAKSAAVIATVSVASQRDIITRLGVREERTAILPGAAHPSCSPAAPAAVAIARARYGLSRPYLLTVGTLEPRKDLLTLLRAFDRLRSEGERRELVVVGGRGWKDGELVRALEERKGKGVRWLGYVSEADLAALYAGADLFAFSPILEGFGLPLLEAMACGAPVVASDIPALREVGGDVARFVPPGDDAGFARAITEMLRDPAALATRAAAGPARAKTFSWHRTAETLWSRARVTGPTRMRPIRRMEAGRVGASVVPDGAAPATLPPPLHPPAPALTAEEWALLSAVVYADLFESPLPMDHALAAAMGLPLDEAKLRALGATPALSPLLTIRDTGLHATGYLVLRGREALVDEMPGREVRTRELLERHRLTLTMLAKLPFVRGLVFSGGVAHKNVAARADIDLFIITATSRVYTAYTMVFLATTLNGTRGIVCPNYLVDESELEVVFHRDLFTAHQLVSARAFSGHPAYVALCRANEHWVRRIFPSFSVRPDIGSLKASPLQTAAEVALWPAAPLLEASLRWAWRFRLRRRAAATPKADVVLSDGIMKLHLSDYRARMLARFATRLDVLRAELGARDGEPQNHHASPARERPPEAAGA